MEEEGHRITEDIIKASVAKDLDCDKNEVKVKDFKVTGGSGLGDGFTCVMKRVEAEIEAKGQSKTVCYMAKCFPMHDYRKKFVIASKMFEVEVVMYNDIIPEMINLSHKLEKGISTPKSFYGDFDEGVLVMENLKLDGYYTQDKVKGMNPKQIRAALEKLAIFHGVSYHYVTTIGLENFRKKFECLNTQNWFSEANDLMTESMDYMVNSYNHVFTMILEQHCEDKDLTQRAQKFEEKSKAILEKIHKPDGKFNCIIHNDAWCNNFLFKDESNGDVNIKLLDLQLCRLASPAIDLCYFLGSSTAPAYRKENLTADLKFYHSALSKTLETLGYDSQKLYSFPDLQKDFDDSYPFAFVLGHLHTHLALTPPTHDAAFNPAKFVEGEMDRIYAEQRAAILEHMKENEVLKSRVLDMAKEVAERNII